MSRMSSTVSRDIKIGRMAMLITPVFMTCGTLANPVTICQHSHFATILLLYLEDSF